MSEGRIRNPREVQAFLDSLRNANWLDASRRWWPHFVYHFTDIRNAVSVLERGALLSRNEASHTGAMITDNASPQVIYQTDDQWKDYARLYFRPRTPTQYHNEGFRPSSHYGLGAHCPMPIYFLFDSQSILTRPDLQFSNGNLASSGSEVFSTMEDLNQMPFTDIYHDGPIMGSEDRIQQVTSRRQAEAIVPNRLDLDSLKFIVCRSEAEHETLLHLLTSKSRDRWQSKIVLENDESNIFTKDWVYVKSVELERSSITFHFNFKSNLDQDGPFVAVVSITDNQRGQSFVARREAQFTAKTEMKTEFYSALDDYSVEFTLDGQIAYAGRYQAQDMDNLPYELSSR